MHSTLHLPCLCGAPAALGAGGGGCAGDAGGALGAETDWASDWDQMCIVHASEYVHIMDMVGFLLATSCQLEGCGVYKKRKWQ